MDRQSLIFNYCTRAIKSSSRLVVALLTKHAKTNCLSVFLCDKFLNRWHALYCRGYGSYLDKKALSCIWKFNNWMNSNLHTLKFLNFHWAKPVWRDYMYSFGDKRNRQCCYIEPFSCVDLTSSHHADSVSCLDFHCRLFNSTWYC